MGVTQSKVFMRDVEDIVSALSAGFPGQTLPFGSLDRIVSRVVYMVMARAFASSITWNDAHGAVEVSALVEDRELAWQAARSIRTTRIITSTFWDSMTRLNVQLLQCCIDCETNSETGTPQNILTRVTRAAAIHVIDDFFTDLLTSGPDMINRTPPQEPVRPESAAHLRISLLPLLLHHMAVQSLVMAMRRYAAALSDELHGQDYADDIAARVSELRMSSTLSVSFHDVAEGAPVPPQREQMLRIVMNSPDFRTMHLRRSEALTTRLAGTVYEFVSSMVPLQSE